MHDPDPRHVQLGQAMRTVRRHLGLAQKFLADRMGCTRQHLSAFETGRDLPIPDTWHRWLKAVGASRLAESGPDAQLHELLQRARKLYAYTQSHAAKQPGAATMQQPSVIAVQDASLERVDISPGQDDDVRRAAFLKLAAAGALAAPVEAALTPQVLHALQVTRSGAESYTALVEHYKQTLRMAPSASLYGELLGVRAHAGSLLEDGSARGRSQELTVAAGWLSNLLALVTYDLGNHTASLVWCNDATRRSQDAGHPELAVWAWEIRALMAYYTGQARQAVAHAQHAQTLVPAGTVGHAKLAAQEMRAWALLGDAGMVASARRRAEQAIAKLPDDVPTRGAFSIRLAEDPPYTAASLLLLRNFAEAEAVTHRMIARFYGSGQPPPVARPAKFAHTYLVLALALAGLGRLEEAVAAGSVAVDAPQLVWPVAVLAGKLNQTLQRDFGDTPQARDFHQRYVTALGEHRPSAAPVSGGVDRGVARS